MGIGERDPIGRLKSRIKQDVAIDLGTANTLVFLEGRGIVLSEPTVIALDEFGEPFALGEKAKGYLGKTPPNIIVKRPMKGGAIEDIDAVSIFLRSIVDLSRKHRPFLSSKVVISIPSRLTQIEKKAVLDAAKEAGFKKIFLIEEAMAAAIGADHDISRKSPFMVVDIGGGTTEVAVISQMAYLYSDSKRIGGDDVDEAISRWLLRNVGFKVGPVSCERLKWEIASVWPEEFGEISSVDVAGIDVKKLSPVKRKVGPGDIFEAIIPVFEDISDSIWEALKGIPERARAAIENDGITLTGGTSLLKGVKKFLEKRFSIPFRITPNPLETIVHGAGKTLSDFKYYKDVFIN